MDLQAEWTCRITKLLIEILEMSFLSMKMKPIKDRSIDLESPKSKISNAHHNQTCLPEFLFFFFFKCLTVNRSRGMPEFLCLSRRNENAPCENVGSLCIVVESFRKIWFSRRVRDRVDIARTMSFEMFFRDENFVGNQRG